MTSKAIVGGAPLMDRQDKFFEAILGQHVRVNPEAIAQRSLRSLAAVSEDVATIAEVVALADRLLTRKLASAWGRRIEIHLPVFETAAFSDDVGVLLSETLGFLTGDSWTISFVQRSGLNFRTGYLPLVDKQARFVMPFSNGLDSFAQGKLLERNEGAESVFRVRAGMLQGDEAESVVTVPRRFKAGHPRELTYRTRPFVYFSFAGIAAATLGAEAIVVGESGQGAIGPSFARFGNEWPFRSAHPGFLRRLQEYLTAAFQKPIRITQPQLWRTKGEVLGELAALNIASGWENTQSCSARPLQRHGHRGCGVCGGCVLRRNALRAAGYPSESTAFQLESHEPLVRGADGRVSPLTRSTRERLMRATLSMEHFASVCSDPAKDSLRREAFDLGEVVPSADAVVNLSRRHANEWYALVAELPKTSWLRQRLQ